MLQMVQILQSYYVTNGTNVTMLLFGEWYICYIQATAQPIKHQRLKFNMYLKCNAMFISKVHLQPCAQPKKSAPHYTHLSRMQDIPGKRGY